MEDNKLKQTKSFSKRSILIRWCCAVDFKSKCTLKRMRRYSAESNGDSGKQTENLKFKCPKLLLFLPAYLLLGFPKSFLTLPILLPPSQHVSKLVLILASLPAMTQFDTFKNSGKTFNPTSKLLWSNVHFGLSLMSPVPSYDLLLHWGNLCHPHQQTASCFLKTCWLCSAFSFSSLSVCALLCMLCK